MSSNDEVSTRINIDDIQKDCETYTQHKINGITKNYPVSLRKEVRPRGRRSYETPLF